MSTTEIDRAHNLYRYYHQHPELSMQEHNTAARIETELGEIPGLMTFAGASKVPTLEVFRCGGTGVVAVMRNGDGPVVAFRADTDGLPIQETTGLDFASTDTGVLPDGTVVPVMHGCGHDFHIASAISAARVLAANPDTWAGTVVFVFQPGEEVALGAAAMVDDGLWDRAPHPAVVFGQHVYGLRQHKVVTREGVFMSMADSWRVTVAGRGAHGSQPHLAIDPIVAAASMVLRLQTVISRETDPQQAAVLTVGTFHAGLKENIIPASAEFTVNIRTFDEATRARVHAAARRIISAEAAASGATEPAIEEITRFPRCVNEPAATRQLVAALEATLGSDGVGETLPLMGSEDFGWLADSIGVPSVYWSFGGYDDNMFEGEEPPPGNHTPQFAPQLEPTLALGIRAAVTAILSRVGSKPPAGI